MLTKPAIGKLNNVFFGNTKKCDLNDNKCKIRFYYLTIKVRFRFLLPDYKGRKQTNKPENRQTNLKRDKRT